MSERLTWEQIRQTYPNEWVVVTEFSLSGRDLTEGIVVAHSKDKRDARRLTRNVQEPRAVIFTGEHEKGFLGLHAQDVEG